MNLFEDFFDNLPEITSSPVTMDEPNALIPIFEGSFQIVQEVNEIRYEICVDGKIWFGWFPHSGVKFQGNIPYISSEAIEILISTEGPWELIIDGLIFGECFISRTLRSSSLTVEGVMATQPILGDKCIPVTKVRFAIPNLRELNGQPTKKSTRTERKSNNSRTLFENDEYIIIIDQHPDYKKLCDSLKAQGGYLILYSGELIKKKGAAIHFDEIGNVFRCFSNLLSFINGRKCSTLFLQGTYEDEIIWTDYTPYSVAQYKTVISWPQHIHSTQGFNELWQNLWKIWINEVDKDFIKNAIHWYTEANSNNSFFAGSLVMAQATLELMYNWYIIEKRKLIIGKDSENLSAANKIRLLISDLHIGYEIPKAFHQSNTTILTSKGKIVDAPDLFVQTRNAIIHSQENKREMLAKMPGTVKSEALQLGLWYIELSLLYILKFDNKYYNRCSGSKWYGEGDELVPWVKILS
ncbi:hypothetical protein AHMF7605_28625 [Adhaeribacter arboris]|uniref:YopA central domain-containing protein n=1 Tax=Adhaeribacter arboris TaxID=2072846 RepID=A0A2T2Y8N2_9BACT|nr:hypothetical protein [Adhaeribacter arboris]PSR51879.1 hypothetical protein AHMF7605_28625 [Adhaeribacter arboris]